MHLKNVIYHNCDTEKIEDDGIGCGHHEQGMIIDLLYWSNHEFHYHHSPIL